MAAYLKINKNILESEKNLICGFVYVPPHTSPFSVAENFDTLENELGEIKELKVSNLLLFGDFNAKTRDIEDCLTVNNYDAFFDLEEDQGIFIGKRASQDLHETDMYGKKLIQLCITTGINIVNGRVGRDKGIGKCTTKNQSTIDYCLASPELFSQFVDFQIQDFNTVLSDVHAPLSIELKCKKINTNVKTRSIQKSKWDPTKKAIFIQNFPSAELDLVKVKLDNILISTDYEKISEVILDLNKVFENAKKKSFPVRCLSFNKKKVWYDMALNRAKKNYCAARKRKNKQIKAAHGKFYKKLLISKFKEHSEKVSSNLRAINSDDPHKYWTTLKAAVKSKTECAIPPADFEEHFKALNEVSSQDSTLKREGNPEMSVDFDPNNITNDTDLCTAIQADLNKPFTLEELSKSIKSLKNNKSSGPDQICNEQIKATFEIMKNFYLKLFNGILDSGIFPDSWAEGLIVPIYKKRVTRMIQIIIGG